MGPIFLFLLVVFASYRLTRLFTLDTIGDRPRAWWWRRFNPATHPLGQLIICPFCIGAWCTGVVVGVACLVHPGLRWPLLQWPAAATAVGFLGKLEER